MSIKKSQTLPYPKYTTEQRDELPEILGYRIDNLDTGNIEEFTKDGWVKVEYGSSDEKPLPMHISNGYDPSSIEYDTESFLVNGFINTPQLSTGLGGNYILRSETFENASWVKNNISTVTSNSAYAPNGALIAEDIPAGTAEDASIYQNVTNNTIGNWTAGVWARSQSGTATIKLKLNSNIEEGIEKEIELTTKWKQYDITYNFTEAHTTKTFHIISGENAITLWGAQLYPGKTLGAYRVTTTTKFEPVAGIFYNNTPIYGSLSGNASTATSTSYSNYGVYVGETINNSSDKTNKWAYFGNLTLTYNSTYNSGQSWNIDILLKELSSGDTDFDKLEEIKVNVKGVLGPHSTTSIFHYAVPDIQVDVSGINLNISPSDVAALLYSTSTSTKVYRLYIKLKKPNSNYTILPQNRYGVAYGNDVSRNTYCVFTATASQAVIDTLPTPALSSSVIYGILPSAINTYSLDGHTHDYMSSTLATGKLFIGNASDVATAQTLSLNLTGGDFGLSNTGVLTMPNASSTVRGLLTSADWASFNNGATLATTLNNLSAGFIKKTALGYEIDTNTYSLNDHKHSAGDITSGVLSVERGGTGISSVTQYTIPYWGTTTALANSANMVWNTTYNTLSIGGSTVDNHYGLRLHRPATTTVFMKVSNTTASTGIEFGLGASGVGRIWHNNNYAISIGTNNTERINISAAGVADFKNHPTSPTNTSPTTNGQLINKGFADETYAPKNISFVSTTSNRTLTLTDAGKEIQMSSTLARSVTIPLNSSVAFPVGTMINVRNINTGTVTIAASIGVTTYGKNLIKTRYNVVQLVKFSTDLWYITGGEE